MFLGEGAAQNGRMAETLNAAAKEKLPLLFLVIDNGRAINTFTPDVAANSDVFAQVRVQCMHRVRSGVKCYRRCFIIIIIFVTYYYLHSTTDGTARHPSTGKMGSCLGGPQAFFGAGKSFVSYACCSVQRVCESRSFSFFCPRLESRLSLVVRKAPASVCCRRPEVYAPPR